MSDISWGCRKHVTVWKKKCAETKGKKKQKIENVQKWFSKRVMEIIMSRNRKKNSYYSIFKSGYLTRISAPSPTIYRISSFNKETNKQKKKKFTEYSGDYTNKAYQWLYLEWWFIICTLEKCCQLLMLHVKEKKNEWKKKKKVKTNPSKRRIFSKQALCYFRVCCQFRPDIL